MDDGGGGVNRLAGARSLYLRQHAENPVWWWEWNAAALAAAVAADKPILLSVGYAACHWCHVMAHESFEDAETAAEMNAHFINIKVDREERPDLDKIYQAAHYIFTQRSGGWPLTMFLTPDGKPFFGGTYFPKQARPGLPTFAQVMHKVTEAWQNQRAAIEKQNEAVLPMLRQLDEFSAAADTPLTTAPVQKAVTTLTALFDGEHGGLGGAPKFPHPTELAFCLDAVHRQAHPVLSDRLKLSLQKMAGSGLTDHIGGGFFRYCTDAKWQLPHFEKMLYDNGLLLALFADATVAYPQQNFHHTVTAAVQWLLTAMRDEDGCFYASTDADSAGGEGAFYVWDKTEIKNALTDEQYAALAARFDLDTAVADGKIHLFWRAKIDGAVDTAAADEAVAALAAIRATRPPPATDNKILCAWNALVIGGLARAGRLLERPDWCDAAEQSLWAVVKKLRRDEGGGRTLAFPQNSDGTDTAIGFLDDVAFLLDATLELLRIRFDAKTLALAESLAQELQQRFYDRDGGGFFFSPADGEKLIRRLKTPDDNATPGGNGIATAALLQLADLTGNADYRAIAEHNLRAFYDNLQQHGSGAASLLVALQRYCSPPTMVYLTGDATQCRQWQTQLEKTYRPDVFIYCLPATTDDLPPTLKKPPPPDPGGVSAHLCTATQCAPPITDLEILEKQITA